MIPRHVYGDLFQFDALIQLGEYTLRPSRTKRGQVDPSETERDDLSPSRTMLAQVRPTPSSQYSHPVSGGLLKFIYIGGWGTQFEPRQPLQLRNCFVLCVRARSVPLPNQV